MTLVVALVLFQGSLLWADPALQLPASETASPVDPSALVPYGTPGAPMAPATAQRPDSWPGGADESRGRATPAAPGQAESIAEFPVDPALKDSEAPRWGASPEAAPSAPARLDVRAAQPVPQAASASGRRISPSAWSRRVFQDSARAVPLPSPGSEQGVVPVQFRTPAGGAPPAQAPQAPLAVNAPPMGVPTAPVASPPGAPPIAPRAAPFAQAPGAPANLRTDFPFRSPVVEIDNATIVARIDSEVILAGEVLDNVNERLAENADRLEGDKNVNLDEIRQSLMRSMLPGLLDTKMVVALAKRKIPKDNFPKVEDSIAKEFDKKYVPKMIKQHGVENLSELDRKLQKWGTSYARVRKLHVEGLLAQQWMFSNLKLNEEVSLNDMLAYYREHETDYDVAAAAKWEQLTVRASDEAGKPAAFGKIAQLGNQVIATGKFADIARAHSEGPTALDGGAYDWTTQGSLKSEVLDRALFTLPVGALSTILEDGSSFHIIRVTERREAGRTPFEEVQEDIRKSIREQRFAEQRKNYVDKLHGQFTLWTIFDAEKSAANLSQRPGGSAVR